MKLKLLPAFIIILSGCSPDKSEEEYFTEVTGLEIVDSIKIIREGDNYMADEGEYWFVFETGDSQISKWITSSPPWGMSEWQRGLINYEIGFHCSLGDEGGNPGVFTLDGITAYNGSESVIEILTDTNNFYAYEERCCPEHGDELRFHNGSLLIINPVTKTVYLSIWDW